MPTQRLLIPVQSLEEILADKIIALAYRARRIKPRDVWDIVWLNQRAVQLNNKLLKNKLKARNKDIQAFLTEQVNKLVTAPETRADFEQEMSRFTHCALSKER